MFVRVWQYRVSPQTTNAFARAYGSEGIWATLFAQGPGYLGTDLYRDVTDPQRWLSVDRWSSRQVWDTFRVDHAQAYAELDGRCEVLTESETELAATEAPDLMP